MLTDYERKIINNSGSYLPIVTGSLAPSHGSVEILEIAFVIRELRSHQGGLKVHMVSL